MKLRNMIWCGNNQLRSTDGRFIAFIMVSELFNLGGSQQLYLVDPPGTDAFAAMAKKHIRHIQNDIKQSLGEAAALNRTKYVTY
ncbi:hypothetical protein [Solitalea lacus]|uniref:hypothetical protein n=1 Tax=Solitalea lacus TaxID=2911172 RepID=UPI001EDB5524|nr:hypothetical protein [Solitalea lacus]UKJ07491.1 hypothetical protein L2B55_18475 [Solitalea lacus]